RNGLQLAPWEPTRAKIANVVDALHAATYLDGSLSAPCWLDGRPNSTATGLVAMANGLLDIRSRELLPHTPDFFAHHALPFAFDPQAPTPRRWQQFLRELWADDDQSQETLAEVMGYMLEGGTEQQKLFMLIGPKRSGKGTVGRVLTGLLGS